MLTNLETTKIIENFGHGKLPSGCFFRVLDKDFNEEIVVSPNSPLPNIYYLKSTSEGELTAFKAM